MRRDEKTRKLKDGWAVMCILCHLMLVCLVLGVGGKFFLVVKGQQTNEGSKQRQRWNHGRSLFNMRQ